MIPKNDPRIIKGWIFYDWANSVFPLVITSAIFPNFYEFQTSHEKVGDTYVATGDSIAFFGTSFPNHEIYSYIYAFALLIVVLTVPVLSGIADYLGNKKKFLRFFCYLGAISCMGLFFFTRHHLELSFIPFITATIGFWGSLVYYNSYLPEIADTANQDKVSAKGFAMGYFGSSLLLILCLVGIIGLKPYGFKAEYSFLLVGLWWIGFAQIPFSRLPNVTHKPHGQSRKGIFTKAFTELKGVFRIVNASKTLKRFLASYFFYNMGVQTIMIMAVLFARKEIDWGTGPDAEKIKTNSLIVSILLIQFLGIAGSFLFSFLSRKIGNIRSLLINIALWGGMCVFTYAIVTTPMHFYIIAATVGLLMGGVQALSRSTYSKLLPQTDDHASFFSFYDVMEKLGMIIGTLSFGAISHFTGGMRPAVLALIAFFALGFLVLLFVKSKAVRA